MQEPRRLISCWPLTSLHPSPLLLLPSPKTPSNHDNLPPVISVLELVSSSDSAATSTASSTACACVVACRNPHQRWLIFPRQGSSNAPCPLPRPAGHGARRSGRLSSVAPDVDQYLSFLYIQFKQQTTILTWANEARS